MGTGPQSELLELSKHTLLEHFSELCAGVVIVDADARVVWMNDLYPSLLGVPNLKAVIGQPVEQVIPNSLMRQVVNSGLPIMLDIMEAGNEALVVTRLPLHDDKGRIIGAVGFVIYDDPRQLAPVVRQYQRLRSELREVERQLAEARRTKYSLSSFLGVGPATLEIKNMARRASRSNAAVLILGETGTGKELLAQGIHSGSARANAPFVAVNIAAIPETLLEAEFFGVAPGAYTGADKRGRDGKFRLAHGGTLFLDEIGDMSLALQAKLLRTLQEHEIEPVGSNRLQSVNVRIIAATSRNLDEMVKNGLFRADLYYRLNVIAIRTPTLRERPEDLQLLAEALVEDICRREGIAIRGLALGAIERLACYDWPGNVRELANILERALLATDGDSLTPEDLDRVMPQCEGASPAISLALVDVVARAERVAIANALNITQGNKAQAARMLGISRASLYEKIAALGRDVT